MSCGTLFSSAASGEAGPCATTGPPNSSATAMTEYLNCDGMRNTSCRCLHCAWRICPPPVGQVRESRTGDRRSGMRHRPTGRAAWHCGDASARAEVRRPLGTAAEEEFLHFLLEELARLGLDGCQAVLVDQH